MGRNPIKRQKRNLNKIEPGVKVGRLVVIKCLGVIKRASGKGTDTKWLCVCECGNTTILPTSHISANHTRSCGCLRKEEARKRILQFCKPKHKQFEVPFKKLFKHYKTASIKRNLNWTLSKEDCKILFKKECHYCGVMPAQIVKDKFGDYLYNGIDRMVNIKGYTLDNVVSCCWVCNRMKNVLTSGCFINHINKIKRNQNKKLKEVLEEYKKNNKDSWQNVKIED